jgi:hypothetical protein
MNKENSFPNSSATNDTGQPKQVTDIQNTNDDSSPSYMSNNDDNDDNDDDEGKSIRAGDNDNNWRPVWSP